MASQASEDPRPARVSRPKAGRQLPKIADLRPLLRPRPFIANSTDRRLARAESVLALRETARRTTPRSVFEYVDGGAGTEEALRRNRDALSSVEFTPRVLRDVSRIDTATDVLGSRSTLPFGFGPTGFARMVHHEGEIAVARVAERAGIPFTLSTMGTTSIEQVRDAAPLARLWFQLYLWRDRDATGALIDRALAAGYEALVLTVDTPVAGPRLRDVRNGLTIPPALTLRTVADASRKPGWWLNLLSTEPLSFASLTSWRGTVAELANTLFDPSATIADVRWLRDRWPRKLIVKGLQRADDAVSVIDAGADAIVISNHGGRQLDRVGAPLAMLASVAAAVGDRAEIIIDGGFRSGSDVAAGLCLGADFVLLGRAFLYGLMAGGERGVDRVVELMTSELCNTMQLLGAPTIGDLNRDLGRLPG